MKSKIKKLPEIKNVRIREESYRKPDGSVASRLFVRIGKKLTGTTAKKRRFSELDDALAWIEAEQKRKDEQGSSAMDLSPLQQQDARAAVVMIREANRKISLTALVTYYLKREAPKGGILPLATAIELFEKEKICVGKAKHYLDRLLPTIRMFQRAMGAVECQTISTEACRRWLYETKANLSPNGRRHYHDDLNGFFNWVKQKEHIEINPWCGVAKPDRQPTETGTLAV